MPLLMIRNDISKVQADAIVNPANTRLIEGNGTSRAIYLEAGEEQLRKACEKIGFCPVGKSVITDAFYLQARYIIHAVGPRWSIMNLKKEKLLYSAYRESLLLAKEYQLESIAFPLLSAGYYGCPKATALKIAVAAISDFLIDEEMLVYLVLYDAEAVKLSHKLSSSVEEYIDNHYVETHPETFCFPETRYKETQENMQRTYPSMCTAPSPKQMARSLDDLMQLSKETFTDRLFRLIDERGLKDSQVYHKANIDRKLFSKIRKGNGYTPSKKTILALAVALELSLDDTKDLLMKAGLALSNCSKSDVIISYFIENKQYDIYEINEVLFAYGENILG
ncbi:MAG: macro domain-containing protein [Lachnospiraceae bacterium]|jgi:O-acetyl-ADP-ribose deacetylase (regulator of RNase III)/transcriptional regulator with XRE-family HTH domain|nr:macro domain-containing protein [Lachnospiraceae bacterium]